MTSSPQAKRWLVMIERSAGAATRRLCCPSKAEFPGRLAHGHRKGFDVGERRRSATTIAAEGPGEVERIDSSELGKCAPQGGTEFEYSACEKYCNDVGKIIPTCSKNSFEAR